MTARGARAHDAAARTTSRRCWSPDGKSIAYRARRQRAARGLRRSEGEERRTADGSRRGARAARSRAISLRSRDRLVARRQVDRVRDARREQALCERVHGERVAGGDSHPVSFLSNTNADALAWSPDGSSCCSSRRSARSRACSRASISCRARRDSARISSAISSAPNRRRPATAAAHAARAHARARRPRDHAPAPATRRPSATARPPARQPRAHGFDAPRRRAPHARRVRGTALATLLSPDRPRRRQRVASPGWKDRRCSPPSRRGRRISTSFRSTTVAKEEPVAKQLTSTPGPQEPASQWSPDGKEIYYIEIGPHRAINVASPRRATVSGERGDRRRLRRADRGELFTLSVARACATISSTRR